VDEAASRIRDEVQDDADIVVGAIFDRNLDGKFRVSVVATGLDGAGAGATAVQAGAAPGQGMPTRTLQ
jgi:cell division protein FtsZ